ncbi:unnamed protein product [Rhizoctonia solani]|uniref:HAT C-terminal dimerisation domain-containing protein n=1 Tax=Rhizoctonia solani TaxID=456999 RepID=A0A8H2XXN3_9AGAM|nr:unnamed protein product [Rhizoctonia solani]
MRENSHIFDSDSDRDDNGGGARWLRTSDWPPKWCALVLILTPGYTLEASLQPHERGGEVSRRKGLPTGFAEFTPSLMYMADVEAELLRWEQYEWSGNDTMGTVNLVEFWKVHRNVFPLLYQIAMNVLPVQASSVSSERAFSSSKMTCTRERNNISADHMEYLQVLKHALHRRQTDHSNHQTLDFMAHIVDPDGDETAE